MEELGGLLELQLREGGPAALTVTGFSMMPMLRHRRDMVWLTRLEREPRKGDLLLYRRPDGRYVLHRVVRVEGWTDCVCCGDNDCRPERVRREDVVGVVCGFCRNGKRYTVRDWRYLLYVRLWTGLFPLRRPLLRARRQLGRWRRAWKALAPPARR